MSSVLNSPTLVLNKHWKAIRIEPVKDALTKAFTGSAKLMDEDTCNIYDWDTWYNQFSFDFDDDVNDFGYEFIRASSSLIRIPRIIVLSTYNKIPHTRIKLTRRNLLIRDKFTCMYTGKRLTSRTATMDHVVPKSRGGKTVWSNIVICSLEANVKKGNRTLAESGFHLRTEPKEPKWHPLYSYVIKERPKCWDKFINTDQWNEIGYWDVELVD